MKNHAVQERLKQAAERFAGKGKKELPAQKLLVEIVEAMETVGGISGIAMTPQKTIIKNHNDWYCLPMRAEYRGKRSDNGREYKFFELMAAYCMSIGISKKGIEYHLGKQCASKHHQI